MRLISLYVNNFRTLVDFKVPSFHDTVIFYGENNAGKSNILNCLYIIFQRKIKTSGEEKQNFYEGIIENFSNNFYNNITSDINFNVEIEANKNEVTLSPILEKHIKAGTRNVYSVEGKISELNADTAILVTTEIKFNKHVVYNNYDTVSYFPGLKGKKMEDGKLSEAFTQLIEPLNDCISIISSNRDMYKSRFLNDSVSKITPEDFKNFMHSLYLSEKNNHLFEKINEVFNRPPFSFGEISFSRENGNLEIMIKEQNIRLPIKHLGSGVLQSLYIIASVIYNRHKIICIEELEQNLSPNRQRDTLRQLQSLLNDEKIGDLQQIILSSHSPVFSSSKLGHIYFLDKVEGKSTITETREQSVDLKVFPKMKKYFQPTMHSLDSYTKEEMEQKVQENISDGEKLLKR